MFGLAEWAVASGDVTLEVFRDRIVELDRTKGSLRKQIRQRLPGVQAKALAQLDIIERVAAGA
jgi:hypothetical protein